LALMHIALNTTVTSCDMQPPSIKTHFVLK
jgi:hypothetical protein